jgi:hypothetical protein
VLDSRTAAISTRIQAGDRLTSQLEGSGNDHFERCAGRDGSRAIDPLREWGSAHEDTNEILGPLNVLDVHSEHDPGQRIG